MSGEYMSDIKHVINRLANGETLSRSETQSVFDIIMSGEATNAQIGAVLMGLRLRGETEEEFQELCGFIERNRFERLVVWLGVAFHRTAGVEDVFVHQKPSSSLALSRILRS